MLHKFRLSKTESGLDFEMELDPNRQIYCFIGENAVGKTALLESWAQVIWWIHAIWQGKREASRSFQGWHTSQRFQERIKDRQSLYVPDVRVDDRALKGERPWGFINVLEMLRSGRPPPDVLIDRPFVFVPSHYRATISNIGAESLTLVGDNLSAFCDAITRGIATSRRQSVELSNVSTWISSRMLINPAFVTGVRTPQHEVIELLRLLQAFDPVNFEGVAKLENDRWRLRIAYQNGQLYLCERPIDKLASGWTALLKIFQEIIASLSAWEAMRNSTDILGSDALIFIDEIDAHLHPRWQMNLLPFLKKSFPNATFVVTTHSPLIVRDTEPGEGYELVRKDSLVTARRLGSPRDWYLSDVLADAFHVMLPAPGSEAGAEGPPLTNLLLDFTHKVREFTASKDPNTRNVAQGLYGDIRLRLPDDDPRMRTVEQLRQLLG